MGHWTFHFISFFFDLCSSVYRRVNASFSPISRRVLTDFTMRAIQTSFISPRRPLLFSPPPSTSPPPLSSLSPSERAAEVIVATTSNLLNGALFGAFFGLVSGLWSTRSFRGALSEARSNGKSWGAISGVYAGLQTLARVVRNRDDRYNAVIGACGSGAAFTMKAGPRAAVQGCVSFAMLSYFIDVLAGSGKRSDKEMSDEEILRKK